MPTNEEHPAYWAVFPADVRYDSSLSPNAKILYCEITVLSNKEGYCWARNAYFARLYKVSESSVSKWLQDLKKGGYIHIDYSMFREQRK